jgi:hypothetical protein
VFGHDRAAIDETVWTVKLLSHLAAVSLQCGAMMYGTARAQNREKPICKQTCLLLSFSNVFFSLFPENLQTP